MHGSRQASRTIASGGASALLALGLWAAALSTAQAGVEFVTRPGDCTKLDTIGDGKDLSIIAGPNVRFRVFGNSVDLSNPTSGFRIATDSGSGSVSARIINQGRDCGGVGFALVEVDSSVELASDIQRSLFFKMPLGDESRLQMRIKAYPPIDVTWTSALDSTSCLGSQEKLNQDKTLRITLPAGHLTDQTTCNARTVSATVTHTAIGEVDIRPSFNYAVSGLPSFMTANQGTPNILTQPSRIDFTIDVAAIRALTRPSNSAITIASRNPNRSSALALNVVEGPAASFAQAAVCRNPITGNTVNVNDLVQCELRMATLPPPTGQLITFEVLDRLCVASGAASVAYASGSGIGTVTLTGVSTIFQVPLRVLSGTSSAGSPCSSDTGVQHTVKFWVGRRDVESGPDFSSATFRIRTTP